jgi:hypothetical protein
MRTSARRRQIGRPQLLQSLFRVPGMAVAGAVVSVLPAVGSAPQAGRYSANAESMISVRGGSDMCRITAPKGPWDYYLARDLPHGSCGEAPACMLWTKDSCFGEAYPGPAIRWRCVCTSGLWQCDEQERSKATCTRD